MYLAVRLVSIRQEGGNVCKMKRFTGKGAQCFDEKVNDDDETKT